MAEIPQLDRALSLARSITADVGLRPRAAGRIQRYFSSLNTWFWALVGLPTLIAGVYYFAIASDLYVSEVKFVVRGPAKTPASALTALMQAAGSGASSEDAYVVHDYLTSRDAVRRLEREHELRILLSRPEGDLLSRFPGIWFWRSDFEQLYWAYSRFVSIDVDAS